MFYYVFVYIEVLLMGLELFGVNCAIIEICLKGTLKQGVLWSVFVSHLLLETVLYTNDFVCFDFAV